MTATAFRIREATTDDREEIFRLLPRLGAFPLPDHREPSEIHVSDERVLRDYFEGRAEDCQLWVASAPENPRELWGFALVRLRPDALNGRPSAHLETLVVRSGSEGKGIGSALIRHSEEAARSSGALTMTLHVFQTNERARSLYERVGYTAEWIRYIKPITSRGDDEV